MSKHSTASAITIHRDRYRACLLGGAIGDALGAAIEFISLDEIHNQFGSDGIDDYVLAYGRIGAITDDTQMTLFTAEGILRAFVRSYTRGISSIEGVTQYAYLRWLYTQEHDQPPKTQREDESWLDGWLIRLPELYNQRSPGNTCLSALRRLKGGDDGKPVNNSKGCGGIMRMAPVGLMHSLSNPFQTGINLAALTHGHPTGQIASGAFAYLINLLSRNDPLDLINAIQICINEIRKYSNSNETLNAMLLAVNLWSDDSISSNDAIRKIGEGWTAEEALAISIYCSLKASSFQDGILMAVNHDGDSDSTGSISGNILGLVYGLNSISSELVKRLELCDIIVEIADDLYHSPQWPDSSKTSDHFSSTILGKYPGW